MKQNKTLPESYRDHKLVGDWTGYRECHIESDWLLVYKWKEENLVLTLILKRTGSHSEILELLDFYGVCSEKYWENFL